MEQTRRITVRWYSQEQGILHIVFHAKWGWDDFYAQRQYAKTMLSDLPYKISILFEYDKDAGFLPTNALSNFSIAAERDEFHVDKIIFVAPSQVWRVILASLKRLLPHSALKNSDVVRTREEGLAILHTYLEMSRN